MTTTASDSGLLVRAAPTGREAARARYPARPVPVAWPATGQTRGQVQERLTRAPFAASNARTEKIRRRGLTFLLDWLEAQPNGGATRGCPTDLFTQNKSQAAQDFYYRPSTIRRSRNAAACIPFVG